MKKSIDEALVKETPESLTAFLEQQRGREVMAEEDSDLRAYYECELWEDGMPVWDEVLQSAKDKIIEPSIGFEAFRFKRRVERATEDFTNFLTGKYE